jgi:UDP-3-O-[3-hydroxymyristoyl] glucosamine N-acyltransferase
MKNLKLFTRSVTMVVSMSLVIGTGWILPQDAMARAVRGGTRVNVNRGGHVNRGAHVNRNANFNNRANVNRNTNMNRNTNINRNTNVNVNRNVNVHGGYGYHGGGYYHNDGIGVGGAIAIGVAGMAIGSMITAAALPPSCSTVSWYYLSTMRQHLVSTAIFRIASQLCRR